MNKTFIALLLIAVLFNACDKKAEIPSKVITFNVFHCITTEEPPPQDGVYYLKSPGADILIYKASSLFGSYLSDEKGKVTITLEEGEYDYIVINGNEKNITSDKYVIAGIFSTSEEIHNSPSQANVAIGSLRYKDLNMDGIINEHDKAEFAHLKVVNDASVDIYCPTCFNPRRN
ncbi:MAG: hypothetical protein LBC98_06515 [Prevotellaceae bacterium]|jgi:hypothetical protein|nr:hypothetical protein [Prevotellaceae bacterium]